MRILFFLAVAFLPLYCICQTNFSPAITGSSLHFIKPEKFFVYDVIDSRNDKSLNDFFISRRERNETGDGLPLREALKIIFNNSLIKDTSLVPVIIDIKQFSIVQKKNSEWPPDELKIELVYQTLLEKRNIDFAFYSYSQNMYKFMKTSNYCSALLQEELPVIIERLNDEVNKSYANLPYKGVAVRTLFDIDSISSPDTLYYQQSKKLLWGNFKGKIDRRSPASAVTGSGYSYMTSSTIKNGVLEIEVRVKCYFLTQSSWAKPYLTSDYTLSHEQLHFDINYLGALRFMDSITKTNFTLYNWQDELEAVNKVKSHETSLLQEAYDMESGNGRNERVQLLWQKKIMTMIKENLL